MEPIVRAIFTVLLLLVGVPSTAIAQSAQKPAAVPVRVITAERKPVVRMLDLVGRVEAVQRVEVRARITGYLEEVLFKEGDAIKEGAPLYRIEKGLFEAAVGQAEGALEKSQAAKQLTEVQLQRAQELLQKQVGTEVARDQALAADKSASATLILDQANLQTAKINLGYTDIASPISGKIGKTNITKGNVVSAQSGVLTTIVSLDPTYVEFPVSERELAAAQEEARAIDPTGIKPTVYFSDGKPYKHPGTINFINVTVNRGTDTVLVRATFPNPDGSLIDGQLVRVGLQKSTAEEKIAIPQSALISDQEGVYVFVADQGKATVRRIRTGGPSGTGVIVEQGLTGGEQVIVEGIQSLRPDAAVTTSASEPSPKRS
ncbi:RND transporter MFP subunit [Bradyrhizobium jicamae]|uniref:RND transporter MFP subunit n=1 Tax=Bradyrhizobium jicamae TaxID=280332 RepID=A0A0R3KF63_9BRAD|nr:RND transporter MFP subunit [Bradyrhizobium jicamae]